MGPEQGDRTYPQPRKKTHGCAPTTRGDRTPGALPACTIPAEAALYSSPYFPEASHYQVPDLVGLAELLHAPGAPLAVDLLVPPSSVGTRSGEPILDLSLPWGTYNHTGSLSDPLAECSQHLRASDYPAIRLRLTQILGHYPQGPQTPYANSKNLRKHLGF